ncbi:MAG TPA: TolC family protein [Acidobacteriaceae bacterium]|nr:TolC family protein [Acidobacteriaceae bacterium]
MRYITLAGSILMGALGCGGVAAFAQNNAPTTPAPYNPLALNEVTGSPRTAVQSGQADDRSLSQTPYLGGIPSGKLSTTPMSLSLEDAVNLALKRNLGGVLASDVVTGARGQFWQALSELLPNVTTATSFGVHQNDLRAVFGLSIPGVPPIIGPFGYFDARAYFTEPVFNWESIERTRSSEEQLQSAELSARDAREIIVLVIVANYLLATADESEVEAATSQRDTAKALFQQASDQQTSGLASAVDVLRAQVQLEAREQKVISARNSLAKQKLALARAIGLPLGQPFELTTRTPYHELIPSSLDDAIDGAYKARSDFRSQMDRVHAAELAKQAAAAERYPSIGSEVGYGLSGVNPGTSHGTIDAAITLRVPVFQGGRVHGDVLQADAELTREKQLLEDLRARIDQEVRDAYLDLASSAEEVSVEKSAVELATQNLEQSRDRFSSGVTDNVEVVQAQDALAIANDAYIASLYSYNLAKISLGRATGVAESRYAQYLGGN